MRESDNKEEYWTNKKGEKIAVKDMSEGYAKNVLRLLLRRMREGKEQLGIYKETAKFIDEMEDLLYWEWLNKE
jgi:hypothetical protein